MMSANPVGGGDGGGEGGGGDGAGGARLAMSTPRAATCALSAPMSFMAVLLPSASLVSAVVVAWTAAKSDWMVMRSLLVRLLGGLVLGVIGRHLVGAVRPLLHLDLFGLAELL